jgi:hypothetical protein
MNYSINVSLNGKFLFSTSEDHDLERTRHVAVTLATSLPLALVEVISHNASCTIVPAARFLEVTK